VKIDGDAEVGSGGFADGGDDLVFAQILALQMLNKQHQSVLLGLSDGGLMCHPDLSLFDVVCATPGRQRLRREPRFARASVAMSQTSLDMSFWTSGHFPMENGGHVGFIPSNSVDARPSDAARDDAGLISPTSAQARR